MNGVDELVVGGNDGPASADAFKRAVYKQPPHCFAVQVLAPQKFGNAYSYGLLITPLQHDGYDRHSIISRTSGSSGSSSGSQSTSTVAQTITDSSTTAPLTTEYEIWRRWEDCLYFQDVLEVQYSMMSKEKRRRLLAGKGVKKNGLYEHEDPLRRFQRAASFESLPPGPDPNLIAKNVHELLPRLTKRGTIFKPSKETIEQRGQEFKALIEALFREGDDVPSLIKDLRQVRVVRDFFGFWRRDQDRIEKLYGRSSDSDRFSMRTRSASLGSRASSIFSSPGGTGIYFSPSNLSLHLPSSTVPEPVMTNRSPRRPAFMQGGKGAINLVPPSPTETGPVGENALPRRRAQTLQGTPNGQFILSAGVPRADLQDPPVSAPANITFADAIDNGYNSDSTNTTSHWGPVSPGSYRTSSQHGSPPGQMEIRFSEILLADDDPQRKSIVEDSTGSIMVDMDDGGFDVDDQLFEQRENGFLVPESIESRLGGFHGLQHLTIKEEDEQGLDDECDDEFRFEYAQSDSRPSESSPGNGPADSVTSIAGGSSTERPNSPAWSSRSTLVPAARVAAAHAEALRALTGGRSQTPTSVQDQLTAEAHSSRSSVLTTTSGSGSGSGSSSRSTNSGHAHSSDTQSSFDMRPYSFQSSIVSCEDIDRTLSSSPIILHSPLLEDDEVDYDYLKDRGQGIPTTGYRPHDSISSVRTFMTDYSMDVAIPPREAHPAAARSPASGANMMHPNFHSPKPFEVAQKENLNEVQDIENGLELPDAFFFAPSEVAPEVRHDDASHFGRETAHGSPNGSFKNSRPVQNRFAGQFSPPMAQQRPKSPSVHSNSRGPARSTGSPTSPVRSVSPSPSTSSYAPSLATSLSSEESVVNAVSIKAIYGEHIIAFKIDRNTSLGGVREKLWHKLVDQQGVMLNSSFSLAYKPLGPGRVQELRKLAGRARSSSASSVGMTDPSSLRILFSQRDWLDAVGSCPPGTKLTLHVLQR